jgi:predicted PurR-regulated permease PerM
MERRTASPTGDWAARFLWLLMTLALIALALYVVWSVRHVITLMLVCGAIAYLLIPLVDWLARWRPRWIAPLAWRGVVSLAVTLGFLALVGVVVVAFLTPFVSEARDFLRDLPRYQEQLSRTAADWQAAYNAWYDSLTPQAQAWLDNQRESLLRSLNRTTDDLQATLQGALQQTGQLVNLLVELFLVPVIVFYLLFDSHRLKRETLRWLPPRYVRTALTLMQETNRVMRGYIMAQLILGVIAGIATWVGLQLMGVRYAATLAMFAGIARAIPCDWSRDCGRADCANWADSGRVAAGVATDAVYHRAVRGRTQDDYAENHRRPRGLASRAGDYRAAHQRQVFRADGHVFRRACGGDCAECGVAAGAARTDAPQSASAAGVRSSRRRPAAHRDRRSIDGYSAGDLAGHFARADRVFADFQFGAPDSDALLVRLGDWRPAGGVGVRCRVACGHADGDCGLLLARLDANRGRGVQHRPRTGD